MKSTIKYITRYEACRALGHNAREGGKCEDAWTLARIAHENGKGLDAVIAAGTLLGLSENNIKIEYAHWFDTNLGAGTGQFHTDTRTPFGAGAPYGIA